MEELSSETPPSSSTSTRDWSLNRVTGPSLDANKYWYVLTKQLCGSKTTEFAKNAVFCQFPAEIKSVHTRELKPASHRCNFNRQPKTTYVASSFGLCAGLMRQRDIPKNGFTASQGFDKVVTALNCIMLESETQHLGGKLQHDDFQTCNFDLLQKEKVIQALEEDINRYKAQLKSYNHDSSFESSVGSSPSTSPASTTSTSSASIEETKQSPLGRTTKKRKVASVCQKVVADITDVCERHRESLSCVLGNSFIFGDDSHRDSVRDTISEVIDIIVEAKGCKQGLAALLTPETHATIMNSMRVPDWVLLYFKLKAKLPDAAWQSLLNLTQLGRSGRNTDTPVLLTKNQIKAIKHLIFTIIRKTHAVKKMDADFNAYHVDLKSVLVWAIREHRLYSLDDVQQDIEFNIKLDGRPLGGKDQVSVGIVPIDFRNKSSESALSVFPIAIANCKEKRDNLIQLIKTLNCQKQLIKNHGIEVDGMTYQVKFTVTVDYKALLLLLRKKDETDKFVLGGKGYNTEFCAFCDAIRACTLHGADAEETCLDCLRSKANIGRSVGLRDDLTFLLEEDLSHINLCSLHCEMRNCEQLLGSVGLFSYRIGSLDELNAALADYGPENCRGFPRVTVKLKPGQQTEVERYNIKVASFSGCTERDILNNIEEIVRRALPVQKITSYYESISGTARQVILDFVTFFEERKKYVQQIVNSDTFIRDFGTHQETVKIQEVEELYLFLQNLDKKWTAKQNYVSSRFLELSNNAKQGSAPKAKKKKKKKVKKQEVEADMSTFSSFAAELQLDFFVKVFTDWREIAMCLREKVFTDDQEEQIDVHDVQCKEWGFLLKKLFGMHLGTGDYGHLTIDHSAMLLRNFRSLNKYSGQGFESSHKLHRQLFSKATNHDSAEPAQSLNQILTHWYATYMLSLRYTFRQARECIHQGKKKLHFRGCGWKSKDDVLWSEEKRKWIFTIDSLFTEIFGEDYLQYRYDKDKGTFVRDSILDKLLSYDHESWEHNYAVTNDVNLDNVIPKRSCPSSPKKKKVKVDLDEKTSHQPLKPAANGGSLYQGILYASTRAELAALHSMVPPVQNVFSTSNVTPVYNTFHTTDPFTLSMRPCAAVVVKAEEVLREKKCNGICITGLGSFTEQGLTMLNKFCDLATVKEKVTKEASWLSKVGCSPSEMASLESVLWHKEPNYPILKVGKKVVDVMSFSELTGERYIDNFIIDVCIGKYLECSVNTIYLPSEFHTWMRTNDKEFQVQQLKLQVMLVKDIENLAQILVPVYMTNHWGLVYIDLCNMCLYFDDGMNLSPPRALLPSIKLTLDLLSEILPSTRSVENKFWQAQHTFCRFGMPSQTTSKIIGTGSCGVGVIMAARDFIENGPATVNNIKWRYGDMDKYRKNLMLTILEWSQIT